MKTITLAEKNLIGAAKRACEFLETFSGLQGNETLIEQTEIYRELKTRIAEAEYAHFRCSHQDNGGEKE